MFHFMNDYQEGCHPRVLEALQKSNDSVLDGYGLDSLSLHAHALIRAHIERPDADIHLLSGGTAANLTAICAFLRPYEAVISASSGHINEHESGSIEATGHKVLVAESVNGLPTPEGVRRVCEDAKEEHMPQAKLLFISNASELGTVYTRAHLAALREVCDEYGLYLYMDGARIGSALVSEASDLTFADLPKYCDCFYIGGTKNGALIGEALVIINDQLKPYFRRVIKQRGGMLAKGRVVGAQFAALMEGDIYLDCARHANRMAGILDDALKEAGIPLLVPTQSNQIFPILTKAQCDALHQVCAFHDWKYIAEDKIAVRFVTSWAAKEEDVRCFADVLRSLERS